MSKLPNLGTNLGTKDVHVSAILLKLYEVYPVVFFFFQVVKFAVYWAC